MKLNTKYLGLMSYEDPTANFEFWEARVGPNFLNGGSFDFSFVLSDISSSSLSR
jgi:hypothetical protein